MDIIKIALLIFALVLGLPALIIDYRHQKNKAYEPGDAWAYYSKRSKQGHADAKFMMLNTYVGIVFIVAVLAYLAYRLFSH